MRSRWAAVVFAVLSGIGLDISANSETRARYDIANVPDWVAPVERGGIEPDMLKQASEGVYYYVLADRQTRLTDAALTRYSRFASKAINAKGVESVANIQISFDPSYQRLSLHAINVLRDGKVIPKLATADVRVLQRETELESLIYDGSMTASVFLDDVRAGDIVDYAYSVDGRNPVFDGGDFGAANLKFAVPVGRLHVRLLTAANNPPRITLYRSELSPKTEQHGDQLSYTWDISDVSALQVDGDTPGWYDPYPQVEWTSYQNWAAVAHWAEPLYRIPAQLGTAVQGEADRIARAYSSPSKRLLAALQLVQSEVRYLGIEIGPNSHAPNPPSLVFDRRFGDCKDKTLLTLSLLDRLGIEARAALVNTNSRRGVKDHQASPGAFDHVIVHARIGEKSYWIDPTRAPQKGGLGHLFQPDYGYALLVDGKTTALTSMAKLEQAAEQKKVHIQFDARKGFDKPVQFTVTTILAGGRAEGMRQTLTSTNLADLSKQYLNFYAGYYAGIKSTSLIEVSDDVDLNQITSTEHYEIHDIATFAEAQRKHTVAIETPDLDDYLRDPQTRIRTAPLALSQRMDLLIETEVLLPSTWPIEASTAKVEDPAFVYSRSIVPGDLRFVITDRLRLLLDEVSAEDTARYLENLAKVRKEVGYELSWTDPATDAGSTAVRSGLDNFNWLVALLAIGIAIFWTWLAIKAYRYDPIAPVVALDRRLPGIRGWLLLPAIGITVTPFRIAYESIRDADVYSLDSWTSLTTYGSANYQALWAPALLFELVMGIGLLAYAVLVMILFYQRRTSLPNLYIGMMVAALLYAGIEHGLALGLSLDAAIIKSSAADIRTVMFSCIIWIPYFASSRRVQSTFTNRLGPMPLTSEPSHSPSDERSDPIPSAAETSGDQLDASRDEIKTPRV